MCLHLTALCFRVFFQHNLGQKWSTSVAKGQDNTNTADRTQLLKPVQGIRAPSCGVCLHIPSAFLISLLKKKIKIKYHRDTTIKETFGRNKIQTAPCWWAKCKPCDRAEFARALGQQHRRAAAHCRAHPSHAGCYQGSRSAHGNTIRLTSHWQLLHWSRKY